MNDNRILRELELDQVVRLYRAAPVTAGERVPQAVRRAAQPAAAVVAEPVPAAAHASVDVAALDWNGLAEAVAQCRLCGLCAHRRQAVLGVGDANADWLFVGEGPGADENAQGEPFVGLAGKLLDGMLKAIGLRRGQAVYIANVVKCRPPANRTPTPEEAQACAPFLDRQIELVGPKLIVALGKTAAARLLATDASLASLRGRVHRYKGIPLVVTYHPAYLLRTPADKAKVWQDLLFARRTLREAS